jgi:hypothetical protein
MSAAIADDNIINEISAIETTASRRNQDANLSGILLAVDRHFMQILEGNNSRISWLLGRLYSDRRHSEIVLLEMVPIEHRSFPEWSMKAAPVSRHQSKSPSAWDPNKLNASAVLNLAKSVRAGLLGATRIGKDREATGVQYL